MTKEYEEGTASEILEARYRLMSQLSGFDLLALLKSAVELNIPETILNHGRPMPLPDLLAALPINPAKSDSLYRLMRVLVHYGFFLQEEAATSDADRVDNVSVVQQVKYSVTPYCRLLMKDKKLAPVSNLWGTAEPGSKKSLYALGAWFQNDDQSPFVTAFGKTFWEFMRQEPFMSDGFDKEMAADSELIISTVMDKYGGVFEGLATLVDVGGGAGTVAKGIIRAFPDVKCTVLDLPDVVANLTGSENLRYVGGDMFEEIPRGDAILLKWVLHNWSDEDCSKILSKCRDAITNKDRGGKLIVIDAVVVDNGKAGDKSNEPKLIYDVCMMANFNSKERTEKEFAKLFSDAGFSGYKIVPVTSLMSLIEVFP